MHWPSTSLGDDTAVVACRSADFEVYASVLELQLYSQRDIRLMLVVVGEACLPWVQLWCAQS